MTTMRTGRSTCLLVGESTLLMRCAEILADREHAVVAIVTPDEQAPAGMRVYRNMHDAMHGLADRPDFLFSVVNRAILSPEEIGFAQRAAINYHDSPLPAYAGVNAPSWAILNGEASHGVTWHLMEAEVDAGDILAQRRFPIDDDDTALSLAAKCYEHALETFGELLDRIEAGVVHGVPQDRAGRTCFPRCRRLPRQGIVRWTDDAALVCRFSRAGHLGPYANDFGLPKILLADGSLVQFQQARVTGEVSDHPAGTVIDVEPRAFTAVAGDGRTVRISGTATLDGRAFEVPASLLGRPLPILPSAAEAAIEAAQVAAAKREDDTRARFRILPAPLRLRGLRPFRSGDEGEHVFERSVEAGLSASAALSRVLAVLLRDAGDRSALVGLWDRPPAGFMRLRPFVCELSGPESLAAAIDRELRAPPVPADLPTRFPELAGAVVRVGSIAVCLSADPEVEIANPGLVICHGHGRLTLRFSASQISATDAAELASILFGDTTGPPPAAVADRAFVPQRISRQAAAAPDAIAIESGRETMTFGELEAWASGMAAVLRSHGAGREGIYAVLLPQGIDFPAAVVAVLKSGAAYVPLDTTAPLHRLRDIVRDARPLGVITDVAHSHLARQLTTDIVVVSRAAPAAACVDEVVTESSDLAYLIYTSGSTGEPKASMIEHGALAHLVDTVIERNGIGPGDRVLQLCPLGFDASVEEIFSALCAGATLVIRSATLLDSAHAFLDFCEDSRLTIIGIYASMLGDVVAAMEQRGRCPPTVRLATTGGEAVRVADAERWRDFFANRNAQAPSLLNVYGLTETTVANLTADLSRRTDCPGDVPIGRSLPGNEIRVVDGSLADVPAGEVGELLLSGPQLARAYWNRPALTASRFFEDAVDGRRWFRTGDLVRSGPGGEVYFVGRVDRQIKVNGVRIELEDVERAVLSHPDVRHAAACVQHLEDGRKMLVAFFSPVVEGLAADLQRHLEQRLPEAMRPRRLLGAEPFPVNDRGKTDYAALAAALDNLPRGIASGETGDAVSRLWKEFFPWSDGEESFFDLGGDSLSALRLLLRVEQETGVLIPASAFFQDATRAGLRRLVRTSAAGAAIVEQVVTLQPHGSGIPIYLVHGISGDVAGYADLVKSFGPERPVFGVRSRGASDRTKLPASAEETIAELRDAIGRHRPEGPWILLGYSWGGVLAYETAVRLLRETGIVPLVILIESLAPCASFTIIDRILHVLRTLPGWTRQRGARGWLRVLRRTWQRRRASPAGMARSAETNADTLPPSLESHFLRLAEHHALTREPRLTIHLIRATEAWPPVTPLDDLQKLWGDYCWHKATDAHVHVHHVRGPGRTALLRQPQSRDVAALIATICRSGESRP